MSMDPTWPQVCAYAEKRLAEAKEALLTVSPENLARLQAKVFVYQEIIDLPGQIMPDEERYIGDMPTR